jgi:hypothetical protein
VTVTVTDLDDEAPTNIRIEGARVVDGITNSSDGPLGFEFITVDDFKIRAVVDGKSKGISSSIMNSILNTLTLKPEKITPTRWRLLLG